MTRSLCTLCPRRCGVDRAAPDKARGYCGEDALPRVAKVMLHMWEEPCVSGAHGAGTVFFNGCSLRCVYCQNSAVSRGGDGVPYTPEALAQVFLDLQAQGAECLDLVTPTHFTDGIRAALDLARPKLRLPVVWNTSGYETVETVRSLAGYADVFLTDFKYCSPELSARYSAAPDYCEVALSALREMVALVGRPRIEGGLIKSGVIVRHLVLPRAYRDSIDVLRLIAEQIGSENVLLSLMAQYTPDFVADPAKFPELCRRITTYEYEKAADEARGLGFDGWFQQRQAADKGYTPEF